MYGYVVVAIYLKLFAEVIRVLNGVNQYPRTDEGLPAHPIKDFYLINMVGYIYKTTNLLNGKIYIGQHQAKKFDRKYYGTGYLIIYAIKKYGRDNFYVCIIHKCYKISSLYKEEKKYIKLYNSTNKEIGYNISYGGTAFMKGRHQTEKAKKLIGISSKNRVFTEKHRKNLSLSRIGMTFSIEHRKNLSKAKKGTIGPRTGTKQTDEAKLKMSLKKKGIPWTQARRNAQNKRQKKG